VGEAQRGIGSLAQNLSNGTAHGSEPYQCDTAHHGRVGTCVGYAGIL
jgi:hypothetical protein